MHEQFTSDFGCSIIYSAYLEEGLLDADSTPIGYNNSTLTFTFTGSIETLGLYDFELVAQLQDLSEIGTYNFQLNIMEQSVVFLSEPIDNFDLVVGETSNWSYTLPGLDPLFQTYVCVPQMQFFLT
jgi:hypothetical protein